jgi:peptide deformylase
MTFEDNFLENYELSGQMLEIFVYPAPVLTKKAKPVEKFDNELRKICRNMLFTMYHSPGVGLAAPQVGISQRFFVLDVEYKREQVTRADGSEGHNLSEFHPHVFINPKIVARDGSIEYEEGCLSVPGIHEKVTRSEKVTMEYQDMSGLSHTITAEGLFAICLQHENDHLDGIVFLERLSLIKRNLLKKKYLKERKKQD